MDTPTTPPVLKRGATRSPSSRPAYPTFSPARPLTLAASTNPHEVLGSDNGMTGQSTGHGQYMPPWTPLYCLCTRLSHSTLPPSAFGNSQHQMSTPLFPRLTSPLGLLPLHGRRSPSPRMCDGKPRIAVPAGSASCCLCATWHRDEDRPATTTNNGMTRAAGSRGFSL